ncbi:hypothetical protein B0H63DRAFT_521926 [Podospora didyma]|uniref:F-box domain-containing protein n=1 Tax=Podospora didyma TaxID=330526 RepID=A0AAE0U289_9PEZI|nr:hypothetical protein B0H63DRAFT_521926 [Podospora didyma]
MDAAEEPPEDPTPGLVIPNADPNNPRSVAPDLPEHTPPPPPPATHFPHGLIGLSSRGFSETVRNSISSFASHHDIRSRKFKGKGHDLDNLDLELDKTDAPPPGSAGPGSERPASEPRKPLHLLTLPPELQLMILARLDFADIERLRRTCKQLRALANPKQIRTLWGEKKLKMQLLGHCKHCLVHDPFRSNLLQSSPADPGYPLASRCIECALNNDDPRIRVGKKIELANQDLIWVCRWCGTPVTEGAAYGNEQFHRPCYKSYNNALFFFFILGWIQLSLGIVGAALAWRYFRDAILVFAPTLTSFLLLWICLGFLVFRGNRRRTYHYTLFLELVILCLWIPPVYFVATEISNKGPEDTVPKSIQAALAMFCLNMLFRLFNVFGNVVLFFEYDMTRIRRPKVSIWRKMFHPIAAFLVFWTYPQAMEQKFPPDYQ